MSTALQANLMTLGRRQFLVVCLVLASLAALTAWAVLSPEMYALYCERYYLPSVQGRFGFQAGRVSVPGQEQALLVVTTVQAGGPFEAAGFRVGDIPVDHHGGLTHLCGALQSAEDGETADITVINMRDWGWGYQARRDLHLPPTRRQP
jgi:hypothetical protein